MITVKQIQETEGQQDIMCSSPFQTNWYAHAFIKNFCKKEDVFCLGFYNDGTLIGYGGFEKIKDKVVFLGMKPVQNSQEVTDYGDIFLDSSHKNNHKEIWDGIMEWFSQNGMKFLQLDYVREDSLTYELFKDRATEQTTAPYIMVPKTWDEYLESLDRVDRKELKRKMRRIETVSYMYRYIDISIQKDEFEEFIRLHRLSSEKKEEFMSEKMKNFFWDLVMVSKKDWKTTFSFLTIDGKNTAAMMSFEDSSRIFGYNSGYDPSYNYYSSGLLLHAFKIKDAIEKGIQLYDFMRGTERYKYDLGGRDMKLYKIEISL